MEQSKGTKRGHSISKSQESSNGSTKRGRSISKSQDSSNGSNSMSAYNLEYCTSSSSLSPFAHSTSSVKTVISLGIPDLIVPSTSSSKSSKSSPAVIASCSSAALSSRKRKRSVVLSADAKDPELGVEPPSAKRHQRAASICQSDPDSIASSVYLSSIDEIVQEIDTRSSSSIAGSPEELLCLRNETEVEITIGASDIEEEGEEEEYEVDDELENDSDDSLTLPSPAPTCHTAKQRTSQAYDLMVELQTSNSNNNNNNNNRAPKMKSFEDYVANCMTPAAEPEAPRQCPLPALSWANAYDVWQLMCRKDEEASSLREPNMLHNHPHLMPRMRTILLDWLIEVCEVYKLHRETYYLALDYLDRYLSKQKLVQKTHLQLLGITCLFIAAKVEEIYPPKIGEFAYVTDGACTEADILQHEILLLQALEWQTSPVTLMGWLGVYMQLNVNNRTPASLNGAHKTAMCHEAKHSNDDAFIYPQFSGLEFARTAQLLDLCSLDLGICNYSYSVVAAAAISHSFNKETALRCSGLDEQAIEDCVRWMEPFFIVISEEVEHMHLAEQNEQVASKYGLGHVCPNINTDDSHIIQTHETTMEMFDRASLIAEQYALTNSQHMLQPTPNKRLISCSDALLTPPSSSHKPLELVEMEEDEEASHQLQLQDLECGAVVEVVSVKAKVAKKPL